MSDEPQVGSSIVMERVTPLRQNEPFKQDEFYKPGHRQTVVTILLRING